MIMCGSTRAALGALGALAFLLLSPVAAAEGPSLPVDVQVKEMVNLPADRPEMKVVAKDALQHVRVVVREEGKSVISKQYPRLGKGASQVLSWRAQPGIHRYVVEVSATTSAKQASVSLPVDVMVMRPLEVSLPTTNVDLENRSLHFTMNNPSGHVEMTVVDPWGRTVHEADVDLSGRPAGARLVVTWPKLEDPIGKILLRIADASGSWRGIELLPFRVDIPHVDVVFETAKWNIRDSERPKLDEAYDLIIEAIKKYGVELKARLYVIGHTDTVGSHGDNMVLSNNRAKAIATYFQRQGGITLPILACGMGETSLAVETEDNVDEQRNRRAQYILAAQPPAACQWVAVSK